MQEAALWEILKLDKDTSTRVQRLRRAVFICRSTLESQKVQSEDVEIFAVTRSTLTIFTRCNLIRACPFV